jgi:hypothetical protein
MSLVYGKCQGDNGTCAGIYRLGKTYAACTECGASPVVLEPWHPEENETTVTMPELILEMAEWLEELGEHTDENGRLYGMFADALGVIAQHFPEAMHWWSERDEEAV